MRSLQERLRACMDEGSLSMSDISFWLGRSRPAVVGWVLHGREPRDIYKSEILRRLKVLERLILHRKGQPLVPHHVTMLDRRSYLKKVYDAADPRVSRRNTAA